MKRWLVVPTLCLVAACDGPPTAPPPAPEATWATVEAAPSGAALEGPARVVAGPSSSAVVTPPFRATVLRVRVREGDVVDAGAPLVDVLMPELLDAAGRSEGARTRLAAWTERAALLTALRTDGLARGVEVSEATARVAEARADAEAARAVLLSAGAREGEARRLLDGTGAWSLRAPLAGVVTRVSAVPGESRDPPAGPLVAIAGVGPVRVEARLQRPVPDAAWRFIDGAGGATALRLVSRAPTADLRDGAYVAWFEPDGDAALTAGALGRVVADDAVGPTGFVVPATAIARDGDGATVRTRQGVTRVTVRGCEGEACRVDGALRAGDEVAVESPR